MIIAAGWARVDNKIYHLMARRASYHHRGIASRHALTVTLVRARVP